MDSGHVGAGPTPGSQNHVGSYELVRRILRTRNPAYDIRGRGARRGQCRFLWACGCGGAIVGAIPRSAQNEHAELVTCVGSTIPATESLGSRATLCLE
jgi:hypothetical protein